MILGLSLDPRLGPLTSRGQEAVLGSPQENRGREGLSTSEAATLKAVSDEFEDLNFHIKLCYWNHKSTASSSAISTYLRVRWE